MIVNIRGTNGSGKTTIVRNLMSRYPSVVPLGIEKKAEGYHCSGPDMPSLRVVGSYNAICGGCDSIASQDTIVERVTQYSEKADLVVFEGIIVSRTFGRYYELAQDTAPVPFIFAFLDTPLDLCIERVKARRLAKGNTKELSLHSITDSWNCNKRLYTKFMKETMCEARWLDHTRGAEIVWEWMTDPDPNASYTRI